MRDSRNRGSHDHGAARGGPALRAFTPHQLASAIRSLDSRLVGIAVSHEGGLPVLVYTFALAGGVRAFRLLQPRLAVASIQDLYPEATALEQAVSLASDLVFEAATRDPLAYGRGRPPRR